MTKYIIKRIIQALITFLIISFVIFALVRIIPGNPFSTDKLTPEQIEMKRQALGLNDPIVVQYFRYLSSLLKGDLGSGTFLYNGVPIKTVLGTCIKNSFSIGGIAILIGVIVGVALGMIAAINRGGFWDYFCTFMSLLGICMPSYIFMIYLQRFFSLKLGWLPFMFDPSNMAASVVLPSVSMSLFSIATIAQFTRNEMKDILDSDFMLLAQLKGVYGKDLILKHAFRNTLIPIITVIAPIVVGLLSGASVIEKIYGINGIGRLMVDAISGSSVDYNYVLVLGMLYSGMYIVVMLVLDVLYCVIDPRIDITGKGAS